MKEQHVGPRLGVINIEIKGLTDTVDLPDPFDAPPPSYLMSCWLAHRDFWRVPTAYAVAKGTGGTRLMLDPTPATLAGVAAAVDRLAPICDLIVGNCGYLYAARLVVRSETPILLSGLQLLPNALESTRRPVGVLTANKLATEKLLATHLGRSRLRIVGVDHTPAWGANYGDWVVDPKVTVDQYRSDLLEVCMNERRTGAFADIGALVLECTGMPYFKPDLVAALKLPVWDIATVAKGLLGA